MNAKGAKERKKTKKTSRPLMSDSSKPRQRKLKHLPSEQSRSWMQTRTNIKVQLHQKWGLSEEGRWGWLCKLESHLQAIVMAEFQYLFLIMKMLLPLSTLTWGSRKQANHWAKGLMGKLSRGNKRAEDTRKNVTYNETQKTCKTDHCL